MQDLAIAVPAAAGLAARPPHVPENRVVEFDIFNPPGVAEGTGLQEGWKKLQTVDMPGVVWTPYNEGHWIITRADLIRKALLDTKNLSNRVIFIPRSAGEEYVFIPTTMDPPEHRKYRAILNNAIGRKARSPTFETEILEIARNLVRELKPLGECEFVQDFAQPFPFTVIMRLLDLPYEDTARLKLIAEQMTRPDGSMTVAEASQGFYDYLAPIIEMRRVNPGDDVISTIISGEVDGHSLSLVEMQNMCALVLFAGLDTVVNALSFMFHFLATNPAHLRQLAENPDVIPSAAEELLRRFPVATLARLVVSDVEIDGVVLKKDDMVAVPSMLTGIDENANACPMDVNFRRERPFHLTFGGGPHACAGAPIARSEVVAALRAWSSLIPEFGLKPTAAVRHQGGIVAAVKSLPLIW